MRPPRYTVAIRKTGGFYKICKVWFGSDGSYYVTAPYHPDRAAFLAKYRVNYALGKITVPFEEMVDRGGLDDDDRSLKLSHHPDGFVQFSGAGVLSGKADDGTIRGMGLQSWPLTTPVLGPAFGMTIRGIEKFPPASDLDEHAVVFNWDKLFPRPDATSLNVEGFYFIERWRRFLRHGTDGHPYIRFVHPSKAVIEARVLLPPDNCALGGFIGIEAYVTNDPPKPDPFFCLAGSTGDVRENLQGELTATAIQCMYPRGDLYVQRLLDYRVRDLSDHPGARGNRKQTEEDEDL